MSAASVRKIRTITGPGNCPAGRYGRWSVTAWAAQEAAAKPRRGRATSLRTSFRSSTPSAGREEAFLKKALIYANRFVFQKASHEESLAGMGTTAVCALVRGGTVYLCHAGDSRAYLFRAGRLTQLTHDHSYVQELVDCGTITVEEAEHHPQKNIITKALGVDYRLEPEFTSEKLQKGDVLLLCTDGLTNMVPADQMEKLLVQGPFHDTPDRLIEAANANGGSDNITALLLAVEPTEVEHG